MKKSEQKIAEAFAELMIERIKEMQVDWQKPWVNAGFTGMPQNISGRHYNGLNALMLMMLRDKEEYRTPVFMTFQQAKKNGWDVKKGEKGFPVELWSRNIKDKDGKAISNEEFHNLSEEEQDQCKIYPISKIYIVFNVEQTMFPEKEPEKWQSMQERFAPGKLLDTEGMFRSPELDYMLDKQTWVCPIQMQQSDQAYYAPGSDRIVIPLKAQFNEGEKFYGTLLHEMAHSTGTEERLNRNLKNKFGDKDYAREELVAEMTSAMMASQLGITNGIQQDNVGYLQSWLKSLEEEPEFILTVMADVNKACNMIQDKVVTEEVTEAIKNEAIASIDKFIEQKNSEVKGHTPVMSAEEIQQMTPSIKDAHVSMYESIDPAVWDTFTYSRDKVPEATSWVLDRLEGETGRFQLFGEQAERVQKILRLPLQKAYTPDGDLVSMLSFDSSKLDVFLPQAVRGGIRVVVTETKRTTQLQQQNPVDNTEAPKLHMAYLGNGITAWEEGDNEYTAFISPDRKVSLYKEDFAQANIQKIHNMAEYGNIIVGNKDAERLALKPLNMASRFLFQPYGGDAMPLSEEQVGDRKVICHGQQLLQRAGEEKTFQDYPLIQRPCEYLVSVTGIDHIRDSLVYMQRAGIDASMLHDEYFMETLAQAESELSSTEKEFRRVCFKVEDKGKPDRPDWRITAFSDDPDKLDEQRFLPRYYMKDNKMLYSRPAETEISKGLEFERLILSQPNYIRVNGRDNIENTVKIMKKYGISFTPEMEAGLAEAYDEGMLMPRNVAARDRIYIHVKQGIASEMNFNLSEYSVDDEPLLEVKDGFFKGAALYDRDVQNAYFVAGFGTDGTLNSYTKIPAGLDALNKANKQVEHMIDLGDMVKPEIVSVKLFEVDVDMKDSVAYRVAGKEELAQLLAQSGDTAFNEIACFPIQSKAKDIQQENTITNHINESTMAKKTTAETPEQVQEQQNNQVNEKQDAKQSAGQEQQAEKQLHDGVSVFQRKGKDGNLIPGVYGVCVVKDGVRSEVATISKEDRDQYFSDIKGKKGQEADEIRKALAEKYISPEGKRLDASKPAVEQKPFIIRHANPEVAGRITEPNIFKMQDGKTWGIRCKIDGEQQMTRKFDVEKDFEKKLLGAFFNGLKDLSPEAQLQRRQDVAAIMFKNVLTAEKQEVSQGMSR